MCINRTTYTNASIARRARMRIAAFVSGATRTTPWTKPSMDVRVAVCGIVAATLMLTRTGGLMVIVALAGYVVVKRLYSGFTAALAPARCGAVAPACGLRQARHD